MARQKRQKHVPQRTCVICRDKTSKRQLTRVVRTQDAGVIVDHTGKQAGRGAYLCDKPTCWDKALHTDHLARALKTTITPAEKEAMAAHRP